MAIKQYMNNGKLFYKVYVHQQGNIEKSLRIQKSKFNILTLKDAQNIEKKLIQAVSKELSLKDGKHLMWGDLVEKWELETRSGKTEMSHNSIGVFQDHISRLHKYTKTWWNKNILELTKGDGRKLLISAKEEGLSIALRRKIKSSVNGVFKWAIEEKVVLGLNSSPLEGIKVSEKSEKTPLILDYREIKIFLKSAHDQEHKWYPIWAFAFLTGMRSGELKALQWNDIDLEKGNIVVSKSYCNHLKSIKSTKAGYWRNVPISSELRKVINLLKSQKAQEDDFVLPRFSAWFHGEASQVLRTFLRGIGINKKVVFHTLRACFATHMMAKGANQAKVMKIGGWKDIKTFQIYLRLAGVDVKGATDVLTFD